MASRTQSASRRLAAAVRAARWARGLTQAQLAALAGVGMKFLYELEAGKDALRTDKVRDVLRALGLQLEVGPAATGAREPEARYQAARDYVGMACTAAGVSLRKALRADELVRALLTGKPAPGKHAHFVILLEEAPEPLLRGLVAQVGQWATPGEVAGNVRRIAAALGVRLKNAAWLKTA